MINIEFKEGHGFFTELAPGAYHDVSPSSVAEMCNEARAKVEDYERFEGIQRQLCEATGKFYTVKQLKRMSVSTLADLGLTVTLK